MSSLEEEEEDEGKEEEGKQMKEKTRLNRQVLHSESAE